MSGRTFLSAWVLAVTVGASGCGYALVGKGITSDPSIKRIGVPLFKDRTGRNNRDQKITQKVIEELLKRGRFTVVQEEAGVDAVVEGEITGYLVMPVGFSGAAGQTQASRYAVTITARVFYRKVHQTIRRVTSDVERIHLNTAVAAFHELVNEIYPQEAELAQGPGRVVLREAIETLVLLLNPFTPHVAEEMWERLGHAGGLVRAAWPSFDAEAAREDAVELAVQVNGKVRGHITVPREAGESVVREQALAELRAKDLLDGKHVVKVLVVPGRLVSVVLQ